MPARTHRQRHHLLRPRLRPGESVLVRRIEGERVVQHAAQEVRQRAQAAVHLPEGRQRSRRRATTWSKATSSPRTSTSSSRTEEIKALEEKATGMIDIVEFVPLAKVDREYLDKVYYLGPDKGGDRAYRLLAAALADTGKAALGQYAARGQAVSRAPASAERRARDGAAPLRRRSAPADRSDRPRRRREADGARAREAAHRADGDRHVRAARSTRTPCASA